MNEPYTYEMMNKLNVLSVPSTLHLKDNRAYQYFARYLFQKALSVYDFDLPEWWSLDYFLLVLFAQGYVCVFDSGEFGVIPQWATLSGLNVFYEPKNAIVANPLIKQEKALEIGKDCVVIKLTPDYLGLLDMIQRYASQMAICAEAFETNTFNTKFAYVFGAKDKADAQTFKALFDQISAGEPAVAVGKNLFDDNGKPLWTMFSQNVASTYIAPDILTTLKRVEANFDTEIGIPNANTDKRERLITDEVNANNVETFSKASLWLDNIRIGFDEVKKMFGLDLKVNFRNINAESELKGENNNYATDDINFKPMVERPDNL